MKQKSMHEYLSKRLSEMTGMQSQIARDTGIAQASISRIARRAQIPSVVYAEKLNDWLKRYDKQAVKLNRVPKNQYQPSSMEA